jgi:hypothetical protein
MCKSFHWFYCIKNLWVPNFKFFCEGKIKSLFNVNLFIENFYYKKKWKCKKTITEEICEKQQQYIYNKQA